MLLECIGNTREHLVSEQAKSIWDSDYHIDQTDFKIGEKYFVYGIIFLKGENLPRYLTSAYDDVAYPSFELAEYFKIIEGDIPPGWVFKTSTSNFRCPVVLPERMANEELFMEKLYDDDHDAIRYFIQLRETMRNRYRERL